MSLPKRIRMREKGDGLPVKLRILMISFLVILFMIGGSLISIPNAAAFATDSDAQEVGVVEENQDAAFLQGVMLFGQNRYPEALKALTQALDLNPDCPEARLLRAICYLKEDSLDQATNDFECYLKSDSESCESLNIIGKLLYLYGFYKEAETYFRRALEKDAEDAVVHSNLGSVLIELGENKKAEACFLTAVKLEPDFAEAYENLGILYFMQSDYEAAESVFKRAIELNEEAGIQDPISHANLGDLYFTLGRLDTCISAYQIALDINPELSGVRTRMGIAWQLKGDRSRARIHYEDAISIGNAPAEAHMRLAELLMDEGKVFTAMQEYRKAVARSEGLDPDPLIALGEIALRMERNEDAFRLYRDAFKLGEQAPEILATLSRLGEDQGHADEALHYFRLLLEGDWHDPAVLLEIARRCAESHLPGISDPESALKIARRLNRELGWKHPGVMYVMASAYANLGDYKRAVEAQSQAILALPEGDPLMPSLMGRLEEYRGRDE